MVMELMEQAMTAPVMTITPIFATPFAAVAMNGTEALNAALTSLFSERTTEEYRDRTTPPDSLCFRSREDVFEWPDSAAAQLRLRMLAGICDVAMAANVCSEAEFRGLGVQARARFTIVRPDGCIPAATAPMASWFALYCVAAPAVAPSQTNNGMLRLFATRNAQMFIDAANYKLRPPFDTSHQVWRPQPGHMAVFPGTMLHEVVLNRSDQSLILVGARVRFARYDEAGREAPAW
jgi:hypothetical protein